MAYVHFRCLERWLNYASRDTCELCSHKFNVEMSRRYSCWQSVRVWLRQPTNLAFILCDLAIGLILTSLALALAFVCILGLNHFKEEGYNHGISGIWSEGIMNFFLLILISGYLATMYSMARDHVGPWYRWWKRCCNVRLIVDEISTTSMLESNDAADKLVGKNDKAEKNVEICGVIQVCRGEKNNESNVCENATGKVNNNSESVIELLLENNCSGIVGINNVIET
ncbi:E3 ubiquitin-protein ligase MARCHF2-like isoform X2 [Macrosteles quadrilineatus]|nr:E3 ubiquitin-protein ligase MARCHF2-like isoform X2 [Macrosteles quadrilineatus]